MRGFGPTAESRCFSPVPTFCGRDCEVGRSCRNCLTFLAAVNEGLYHDRLYPVYIPALILLTNKNSCKLEIYFYNVRYDKEKIKEYHHIVP